MAYKPRYKRQSSILSYVKASKRTGVSEAEVETNSEIILDKRSLDYEMAEDSPVKSPTPPPSIEMMEAELDELSVKLLALKSQFQHKTISKDFALKFSKNLKDMSVFITGCYATGIPPPKRYSCGVGYQSTDENEPLLGNLVRDVIVKKMQLPSNPKKEDMFRYMAHSTVIHMVRCSGDGGTPRFNPKLVTEWKRMCIANTQDPNKAYEAVLKSVNCSSADVPIVEATDGGNCVSVAATTGEPKLDEVFDLLKNKSSQWNDIGRELKVRKNFRDGLFKKDSFTDETKLEEVLNKWIQSRCSDVTWRNLVKVLKNLGYNDILRDPKFKSMEE